METIYELIEEMKLCLIFFIKKKKKNENEIIKKKRTRINAMFLKMKKF